MKGRVVFRSLAAGAAALLTLAAGGAAAAHAAPYAYATTDEGPILQYDISTGGLTALSPATVAGGSVTPIGLIPNRPAVSPDGGSLYAAMPGDDDVLQYDIGSDGQLTPKSAAGVAAGSEPTAVAVSPDGATAYVANYGDGTISEYHVGAGGVLTPLATIAAGTNPVEVVVAPDGSHAYALNSNDGTISKYDVGAGGVLVARGTATAAPLGIKLGGLAISADGRSAYVTFASGGPLLQYDVDTDGSFTTKSAPALPSRFTAHGDVALSPDGSDLYVNDANAPTGSTAGVSQFTIGAGGAATWASHVDSRLAEVLAPAPDGNSVYAVAVQGGMFDQFDRAASGVLSPKTPADVVPADVPAGIAVTPSSDVSLSGAADQSQVTAGRTVAYTFTATNSGSPASDVRVTDSLPSSVTFQSASASQGSCAGVGTVTCELGSLASGASATVTITVRALDAGTLTNSASVQAPQPDPNAANNNASVDVAVASAPLATTSEASALTPTSATLNGVVVPNDRSTSYSFEYGEGDTLDHRAPTTPTDAGSGVDAVAVSQPVNGLAPATRYSFRLVATNADGATAVGATRSFTTAPTPVPAIDLGLTGDALAATVGKNDVAAVSFTVANGSATDAATGVRVLVPLPAGAALAGAGSARGCAPTGGGSSVTCAVGTLGPRSSAKVTVPLVFSRTGEVRVTGVVSGAQPDPTADNDVATVLARVAAPPSVSISGRPRLVGKAVRVKLACTGERGQRCAGKATLTAANHRVGSRRYSLAAGSHKVVKIRLSKRALAQLARRHRLTVNLTLRPSDGGKARHRRAVL